MKIVNFGSLNVDHVYGVDHISVPGETVSAESYVRYPGGKGANQSVALARAGASVWHAGMVGPDGQWLIDLLQAEGVDTCLVRQAETAGGHAIIQVDRNGQNSILVFGGANKEITPAHIQTAASQLSPGDILLLQNEVNSIDTLIQAGHAAGAVVCLNPAPISETVRDYPLHLVDILVLNEHEALGLTGTTETASVLEVLGTWLPETSVCLTLGGRGSVYLDAGTRAISSQDAFHVTAVDTTAAGDTFIGFLLAGLSVGTGIQTALRTAAAAAAISVTRSGAIPSIPSRTEVEAMLLGK